MPHRCIEICLSVVLALLSAGEAKTNLRPYIARRHHALSHPAHIVESVPSTRPAAFVDTSSKRAVAEQLVIETVDASPPRPALTQLSDELTEVKQLRANVATAEKALEADVSLLRESAMLERVATSSSDRLAAHRQVVETEKIVKEAEVLVKESRASAVARAQSALREASDVQKAADELSAAAMGELKGTVRNKNSEVAPEPVQTEAEEVSRAVKRQSKAHTKTQKSRKSKTGLSARAHARASASAVLENRKVPMKEKVHAAPANTQRQKKVEPQMKRSAPGKATAAAAHVQKRTPTHLVQEQNIGKGKVETAHRQKVTANATVSALPVNSQTKASTSQPVPVMNQGLAQTKPQANVQKSAPTNAPMIQKKAPAHVQVSASVNATVVHAEAKPAPSSQVPSVTVDVDSDSDSDDGDNDDSGPVAVETVEDASM